MKKLLLLLILLPSLVLADNWTNPTVKNARLQASETVEVCAGTGDVKISTGCGGAGTLYSVTLDSATGDISFPNGALSGIESITGTGNRLTIETDATDIYSDLYLKALDDIALITDTTNGGIIGFYPRNSLVATFDTGGLDVLDGAAATPAYSFINDPDTGIFSNGANAIGLSTGGTSRFTVNSAGSVRLVGGQSFWPDGSAGAPSYSFNSDSDTGEYLRAVAQIGWTIAGTGQLFLVDGGLYPETNNDIELGDSTRGFTRIHFASPDGSVSRCSVDNSDNFTCTGL